MHISSTTHISTHRKWCHCVGLLLFRGVIELGEKKENTYQSLINRLFQPESNPHQAIPLGNGQLATSDAGWPSNTSLTGQVLYNHLPTNLTSYASFSDGSQRKEWEVWNFTTLKFQVVRIWNLANLTLEEIFPDSWFPVLLHLDFGYLDCWAYTHICSSCREYYFKYKELTYLSHTIVCTFKISRHAKQTGSFLLQNHACVCTR